MIATVTVETRDQLLRSLSPHAFRTGSQLGEVLGLSRAAIHKHIRALVDQGVPIHRVPRRGYKLADGVVLLHAREIERRLTSEACALVDRIEVVAEVDSTSQRVSKQAGPAFPRSRVCLAEKQSAGRGRRGRSWVATPYRDLMMSVGVEYPQWPEGLPALGLAASLAILDALESLGARGLLLKWPNDIVAAGRKLCGVLLDVTGEAQGPCKVVIGVGINVSMAGQQAAGIDQAWIDLEALTDSAPDRNELAARCLDELLPMLVAFRDYGFAPYLPRWRERDALEGRTVALTAADGTVARGRADGIDETGRLRVVDDAGATRLFSQGDVSARLQ